MQALGVFGRYVNYDIVGTILFIWSSNFNMLLTNFFELLSVQISKWQHTGHPDQEGGAGGRIGSFHT